MWAIQSAQYHLRSFYWFVVLNSTPLSFSLFYHKYGYIRSTLFLYYYFIIISINFLFFCLQISTLGSYTYTRWIPTIEFPIRHFQCDCCLERLSRKSNLMYFLRLQNIWMVPHQLERCGSSFLKKILAYLMRIDNPQWLPTNLITWWSYCDLI
jgi:hypothetical protein